MNKDHFSVCATVIIRWPRNGTTDLIHVNVKSKTLDEAHEELAKAIKAAQRKHRKENGI